jgi:hypothetical protein
MLRIGCLAAAFGLLLLDRDAQAQGSLPEPGTELPQPAPESTPEAAPTPPPAELSSDTKPEASPTAAGVPVHIDSNRPVELFKRVGSKKNPIFEGRICASPCDTHVEPESGAEYFIDSDQVTRSASFSIERPGPIRLKVDAGSSAFRTTGGVLIGVGSASAVVGTVALMVYLFTPRFDVQAYGGMNGPSDALPAVGYTTLGLGAAMGIVGVVVMATSGTRVAIEPPKAASETPLSFSF